MKKIDVESSKLLQVGPPSPVVLVTCISKDSTPNILTLGMYMTISSNPPLIAIGVSPKRYSHNLIKDTGEFVVNVPSKKLVEKVIICGTLSGREKNKFKESKLTPIKAEKVRAPLVKECISHLECKVIAFYEAGDHSLIIGQVVHAKVNEGLLKETLDITKGKPLIHKGGNYFIPKQISKSK